MKNIFQKFSRNILILIVIFLVGLFLRTYAYHDLLRFNPDQARDTNIVRNVLAGKERIPLLGPKAGGTQFRLGPAFYYFEIASAKIFGALPTKMAYPDLLTSLLSIPLLYFFLRKYINRQGSLWSIALFAVSFYAIKYARFAWNPNSTPFYVLLFLYSLTELSKIHQKRKFIWAIVLGIAIGVGVQLHSLLLFSFPLVFIIYFSYLFFKKNYAWRWAPLIILVALSLNAPTIISEIQTKGANTQAFFQGMKKKSSRQGSLMKKISLNFICHIQGEAFMVLPVGSDHSCSFMSAVKTFKKNTHKLNGGARNIILISDIIGAMVFSLGGYWLLFYFWRKEKDRDKKIFLGSIILYTSVLFLILIPLAEEISFRFFLVLEFLPFLFIGLWIKFLTTQSSKKYFWIVPVLILISLNIGVTLRNFAYLKGRIEIKSNSFEIITLGEVKYMADFIKSQNQKANNIYIDGKAQKLFKIIKPIKYFTNQKGFKISRLRKKTILKHQDELFLINVVKNPDKTPTISQSILSAGKFARVRIYKIR